MDESDNQTSIPLLLQQQQQQQQSSNNTIIALDQNNAPVVITLPPECHGNAPNVTTNFQISTDEDAPNPHMCYAICTCLFCFCPMGLAALITSIMCSVSMSRGDVVKARLLANLTEIFAHISLVIGIIVIVANVIFIAYMVMFRVYK